MSFFTATTLQWNGDQIYEGIGKACDNASEVVASRVAADARELCPEGKTGQLKRSIKEFPSKFKNGGYIVIAGSRVAGGLALIKAGKKEEAGAYYAHMVEYGTVHSDPHSFIRPALEQNREEMVHAFIKYIKKEIK